MTWRSPDGRTTIQIDHVLVTDCMRSPILNTRVMRGADICSEHYLVRTRIRLKLARNGERTEGSGRFNVPKLQTEKIRKTMLK